MLVNELVGHSVAGWVRGGLILYLMGSEKRIFHFLFDPIMTPAVRVFAGRLVDVLLLLIGCTVTGESQIT